MNDTIQRFTNRVENYVKYRPDYPREVIGLLRRECGLNKDTVIADVGCGTGISTRMFLENGNRVFGVEPNKAMRDEAIEQLAVFPWFLPIDGTAEKTTLPESSVDLVVAAQAFHWFDPEKAGAEFLRLLRPGGHIVLMWNERRLDATPFLVEYEAFLLKYARDYEQVRHDKVDRSTLDAFFPRDHRKATYDNFQDLDFEGIKGRMLSSSYMPSEDDEQIGSILDELRILFANHAENGRIKVFYDTKVYYSPD
ncbi:class I SAM-dependent methyltransferase [soil metagenome]